MVIISVVRSGSHGLILKLLCHSLCSHELFDSLHPVEYSFDISSQKEENVEESVARESCILPFPTVMNDPTQKEDLIHQPKELRLEQKVILIIEFWIKRNGTYSRNFSQICSDEMSPLIFWWIDQTWCDTPFFHLLGHFCHIDFSTLEMTTQITTPVIVAGKFVINQNNLLISILPLIFEETVGSVHIVMAEDNSVFNEWQCFCYKLQDLWQVETLYQLSCPFAPFWDWLLL